jgi:hypothetical protein
MGTLLGISPDRNDQAAEHHTRPRRVEGVQLDLFALDFFWRDRLEPADEQLAFVTARALGGEDRHAQRHRADGADQDNLHRLEASIRWLQNETAFRRLPCATPLPAVPGLPAIDAEVRGNAEPERLAPPRSLRRRRILHGLMYFMIGSAVAAPLAYYFVVVRWLPTTELAWDMAGAPASINARLAAFLPAPPNAPAPIAAPVIDAGIGPAPDVPRASPPMAPDPEDKAAVAEAGTMHEPNPLDRAAPPSSMPPSHPDAALDPREIAALIERGRRYFEAGDLAAARLVFGRAANAGDASAALAMGATYDPTVLANRFIRGMGADLDKARSWYEKARELGSPEGPRRLEMLARR